MLIKALDSWNHRIETCKPTFSLRELVIQVLAESLDI